MIFTDIRLQSFRSYADDSFELDEGVNIIVGPNASGKSNLIEAILMICQGSSYRARDIETVTHSAPWARVDVHTPGQRTLKLVRENESVRKEFVIDDQTFKRLSAQKSIPVVLFEPNHLLLLSGGPQQRREFLDGLIEQLVPGFGSLRRQYTRTLAQRNALLKRGEANSSQLFAWNIRLSELAGQIVHERIQLIDQMNERLGSIYSSIAKHESTVTIKYKSACNPTQYSSSMLKKLEQTEQLDYMRGFTAYGPHRDDIVFELNGRLAIETASRGEIRTLLLAIKTIEITLIEQVKNQKPILLLDDVFSELDGSRRRALTEVISGYQTFITTTDADVVVQHFMEACNIIPLQK
jgi:DNA replication and repair protein RecF